MHTNSASKIFSSIRNISTSKNALQFVIIAVTIFATVIASYWGTMKILVILVAGVIALLGLYFLIKYPNLGFIFILLSGWFVRFQGPGGFNAAMLMVICMFVLWLLDMFVVKQRFEFVHSKVLRPVGYFMLTSIIAFAIGQIRWFPFARQAPLNAQLGGFAIYFFLVALVTLTANTIYDIRWLKAFIWVFVGLGTAYIIVNLANISVLINIPAYGAYTSSMFWIWMVALPFGQALFNNGLKLKHRLVLFAIVAATFYVAFQNNDWKSGWVPAAVSIGVLLALRFKKLTLMAIPFALIVAGFIVNALIAADEYSWGTRVDAWIIVLNVSKISPLIGLGFANYYWYVRLVPIRGYYNVSFNSHNQFVDLIAQTGIAGLICFMWIMFEVARLSWSLMQKLPSGFERAYAYAVFAGMCGTLMGAFLGDWVLPFTYNIGLDGVRASVLPWIFFGGLVAIEQMYKEKLILSSEKQP